MLVAPKVSVTYDGHGNGQAWAEQCGSVATSCAELCRLSMVPLSETGRFCDMAGVCSKQHLLPGNYWSLSLMLVMGMARLGQSNVAVSETWQECAVSSISCLVTIGFCHL